ncbi:MAG TPA: DUF5054 domain-containing protein, partial [Silvibacterium sp.]|nr:DUF5054 domain-containing protein [Silvibacterium sp.]
GCGLLSKRLNAMSLQALAPPAPTNPAINRVLVMFKCHFDAGFIDTQAHVVQRYFSEFFPQAILTAQQMRRSCSNRYVWTTGSWLLYEYLEQASPEDKRRMEQAIADGDIAWHALPFNWQTEMMDRSLISGSLSLSHSLDRRFGRTTTGAKMTDVPGHTRGLIAPLAEQGVNFLDIGVNGGSTPAELPPLFVWNDPGGASIVIMYHHEYGSIACIPGSDVAIAVVVRGDNSGPHTPQEIAEIYADLTQRFPRAKIVATNLTEIGNAVQPYRNHLPVETREIGDTWIYGVASDPLKVARYRELCRLRQTWIAANKFQSGDATDLALLRRLLLEAEHTWGTDTKTWLDFDHYTPRSLEGMLNTKNYKVVEFSWKEKRQDLFDGIAALPAPLRDEAQSAIAALAPTRPEMAGSTHTAGKAIETDHFLLSFDPNTGAIHKLRNKQTSREWASPEHPLALFSYQTLSQEDYQKFLASYLTTKADWAQKDFGKPNIERYGAGSQSWSPRLEELRTQRIREGYRVIGRLHIDDAEALQSGRAAFPGTMYVELILPSAEPIAHLNFYWFDKPATRMPEALWLTFDPIIADPAGWSMDKSDQNVSPFDVVTAGSRHLHAVTKGFGYKDPQGSLEIETLDAPLIALGEKSPLNFSRSQPDLASGIHCCLFNNAWGTNYIMWFKEDMRFRFVLRP